MSTLTTKELEIEAEAAAEALAEAYDAYIEAVSVAFGDGNVHFFDA